MISVETFGLMELSFSECEYIVAEALEAGVVGWESCQKIIHSEWI